MTTVLKGFALLALVTATAFAQGAAVKEDQPGLLKRAKVTPEAARVAAQAKVPGGTIKSAEIEMEKGKLIYSFDIVTKGKVGVDEVTVDAMTGAVIGVEHESAADEKKEKAQDARKGNAKPTAAPAAKPA